MAQGTGKKKKKINVCDRECMQNSTDFSEGSFAHGSKNVKMTEVN